MRIITDTMFFEYKRAMAVARANCRICAILRCFTRPRSPLQFNVRMRRVKHCSTSRLLFRRGGVRCEAFKVRYCFLARREAELDDAWSSYEIAQAILIMIGNNESFRPVLFAMPV
jgi:hypothetical protein